MTKIGTIINFCSLDARFIGSCVAAAAPFSDVVVVPWADHLFDNTPEDTDLVARIIEDTPGARFVPFEYHHSITEMLRPRFWHNYARWVGLAHLPEDCDWVLFLDADEIVETDRFREFLAHTDLEGIDHLYFANYWYFREPRYRARQIEDSPALIRRRIINVNRIFHEHERAIFRRLPGGRRRVSGLDGKPMFHHYSWVMDKAGMLRKVRSWGHSLDTDRDWAQLVETEFSREFTGRDFVHGYDFDTVTPLIDWTPDDGGAPETARIEDIDLAPLSRHVATPGDLNYFLDTDFKEHYRLLAFLGERYTGATLFDIGTYRGYSALALAYNRANRVVSYDVTDSLAIHDREALDTVDFVIGDVLVDDRLLAAPLILLDVGHDGTTERRIYQHLDRCGYRGVLILDDIHLNAPMKAFWEGITKPKMDVTRVGHVTGTGLVFFGEPPAWAAVLSPSDNAAAAVRSDPMPATIGAADGLRLGFHSNQLGLRGSDVALFDYAYFSRQMLGADPVIIADGSGDLSGIEKFRQAFPVVLYQDFSEVAAVAAERGLDAVYFLKSGADDGKLVPGVRNLVHAAFQTCEPHGDVYAYVSRWLAEEMDGGRHPWVPHIVHLPETDHHFRRQLGIPESAMVFGRHGGRDQFNIPYVRDVVTRVADAAPDIYFLFMNTDRFCDPMPNIIHLNPTWDPMAKAGFINTCDAMLHARIQGESFGLAIGEFLLRDRPVIACGDGIDRHHLAMLGDLGHFYRHPTELFDLLTGFRRKAPAGAYSARVRDFSPEAVMARFRAVFLEGR